MSVFLLNPFNFGSQCKLIQIMEKVKHGSDYISFLALELSFPPDQCKSLVSVTLLTCPWYELSQRERGEQAKHNVLLVIFCSKDDQFFSPANQHVRENASVIDFVCFWFFTLLFCCFFFFNMHYKSCLSSFFFWLRST